MTLYDFEAKNISGQSTPLSQYKDHVVLVVNVASKCGFTPQYQGLEKLYQTYKDRGFDVLGFPCNQFGSQEPAKEAEIQSFCELNFGVKFPLFSKVDVNGSDAHPLYRYLSREKRGFLGTSRIKWNFTKFLIDRHGNPIKRYSPTTAPEKIAADIEKLLG